MCTHVQECSPLHNGRIDERQSARETMVKLGHRLDGSGGLPSPAGVLPITMTQPLPSPAGVLPTDMTQPPPPR